MVKIAVHRGLSEVHHCVIHSAEHTSHCVNATSTHHWRVVVVCVGQTQDRVHTASLRRGKQRVTCIRSDGHGWKRVVSTLVLWFLARLYKKGALLAVRWTFLATRSLVPMFPRLLMAHRSSIGVTTQNSLARVKTQHCGAKCSHAEQKSCRSVTDPLMVQVWRRHVNTLYPTLQALSRADMSQHDQNLERAFFFQVQDRAFVCRQPKTGV